MAELKYVDWDGLVYYDGKIKEYIQDRDENYVKMGGILSFDKLPDPTYYNLHYIYKITDKFTTNSRFETPGLIYEAGTWVQCVDLHEDASKYRYIIFNEETIGGTADIDLSDYYTKSEVEALIPDTSDFVTKEQFDVVQNKTESNEVKINTLEEDLGNLSQTIENLATKDDLKDAIESIDLDGYATEEWVNTQGFAKSTDLSDYAKKTDIPQPELFVVDYNNPSFLDAAEAYRSGKLLLLSNAAPDVNSYAIMNYVRDDIITFTKFLMSRSNSYGAFNTYYLHADNTWEVSKEVRLNKVEAKVDDNNDITGLVIGKDSYDFDNFATTENITKINQDIENIENTYVTNETLENNYVSNIYITENYTTTQELESTYVTNEKVTEQIEKTVTEVIQEKVDTGEIEVSVDRITYGEF